MSDQAFVSTWEENIYRALQKDARFNFEYQVPRFGGQSVRGGTVIDFVIYTVPHPTALYVDGPYWHPQKKQYDQVITDEKLKRGGFEVVHITTEAETYEAALKWVKTL